MGLNFRNRLLALADAFMPRSCPVCGCRMQENERLICFDCNVNLPRLHLDDDVYDNPFAEVFYGFMKFERAIAFMKYNPEFDGSELLRRAKYFRTSSTAVRLGEIMAEELRKSGIFEGIEGLVPIPLTGSRMYQRGFNQSEMLCKGVHKQTSIPIIRDSVMRSRFNQSQTMLSRQERFENVENAFFVVNPARLQGRHVLLVDDVVTTGATMISCAKELLKIPGCKVSIMAFGWTRNS